jgi:glycosyltransferase involved in cell wall biosynthesis
VAKVSKMRVAVNIAAYKEAANIGPVIEDARQYGTVFVVNDGSPDNTAEVARRHGAVVISHPFNLGQGSAVITGFKAILARDFDVIVNMDADGQHRPVEIPGMVEEARGVGRRHRHRLARARRHPRRCPLGAELLLEAAHRRHQHAHRLQAHRFHVWLSRLSHHHAQEGDARARRDARAPIPLGRDVHSSLAPRVHRRRDALLPRRPRERHVDQRASSSTASA